MLLAFRSRAQERGYGMGAVRQFPTTHWSEVARAGAADPETRLKALEGLLGRYLPAFRAHLQWRGIAGDEVDDLVQGFICDRVMAEELVAGADRRRGKFRTYLLTALDRHVARVYRYELAQKRRPPGFLLELGAARDLAAPDLPAPEAFDLAWARQVVAQAIAQMRKDCEGHPRRQVWDVFEACALAPLFGGTPTPRPPEVMERFGLTSPQQASNLLATGKRTFARALRSVVAEYADDEGQIDNELKELWAMLAQAGRRSVGR